MVEVGAEPASAAAPSPPTVGTWTGLGLALTTGLLFYLGFPGADLWGFSFLAFAPWAIALRRRGTKQAALQGLALGVLMGVFGFYWLRDMLVTFSGFSPLICSFFMLIVCAYQAGRYALMGALVARGTQKGYPFVPTFLVAFAASEQLWPMLFPFSFGASLHEVYPLLQVAELGGPIAVGLLAVAPALALGQFCGAYLDNRGRGLRFRQLIAVAGPWTLLTLLLTPVLFGVYGVVRMAQVDEAVAKAEKIRVGIVQANMALGEKRTDVSEGLRRHTRLTEKLREKHDLDLVVWPETSVAGAVDEDEAAKYYKARVTGRLHVPAIVGAVLTKPVDDERGNVFFNSALIADRSGRIKGRYDKQFLVTFSEYIPFGDQFPVLYEWSPNSGRFSPGKSFEPLQFGDHKIAVFICYEDIAPSFVNRIMQGGEPVLLVNLTNDAWFGDTSEPWEHMALAKLRAVEQRRFLVRSTNSGISGIVDPVGRMVGQTKTFQQATLARDVALLQLGTGYRLWGDAPFWLASLASLVMAFVARTRFARPGQPPAETTPTDPSPPEEPAPEPA